MTMLVLLSLLFWRLQTHQLTQQQTELTRALETARDSISARLEGDEGFLRMLTDQFEAGALTASEFDRLASGYVAERSRITAVYFVRSDHTVRWVVPDDQEDQADDILQRLPEHNQTFEQATASNKRVYSKTHIGRTGRQRFDLYAPVSDGKRPAGAFVASYSSRALLRNTLERAILQGHHTELIGEGGRRIYHTPMVAQVDPRLIDTIVLTRPDNGMALRLSKYAAPFWDGGTLALVATFVALACGIGLGMWALNRQIAERVRAELALQDANADLEQRVGERTRELSKTNTMLAREMAERQEIEEQARRHLDQLAQMGRVSTMGEMAAGLAHELHQPLGAISSYARGCLRLFNEQSPDIQRIRYAVVNMDEQSTRAADIIDRLRTFLTPNPPRKQPHDLVTLIEESARFIEPDRKRMEINLVTEVSDRAPAVLVDRVQIQQVVLNLLKNAFESIHASGSPQRSVRISAEPNGSNDVKVHVRDTGKGCTPEELQRIFEPFVSTKTDSMGMGLSISRTIIEAHDGRLWATPNADRGMTFSFSITAVTDEETPKHA